MQVIRHNKLFVITRAQSFLWSAAWNRFPAAARAAIRCITTPLRIAVPLSCVLQRRQKRLLRCLGPERDDIQALACAAAAAKARHRLREWRNLTRAVHGPRRCGRGIDGEAAELPIRADRTQRGGARDLIVGDVVDLESAAVDVAQHQVGRAGG